MSALIRRAVLIGVCVLLPSVAWAQASIGGVVKDTSGAVMPGATVEVASPALIEQTRAVVTDGNGQYRVVDLRPGTYSVTITLPGFKTVKRDGIELIGSFAANIDVELQVGGVEETVTVTGQSPIVDVTSVTQQRVFNQAIIEAIPAGRSHINVAVLIPGLSASQPGRGALADVGGTNNLQNTTMVIHGSRQSDTRLQLDGVRVGNVLSEGQFSNFVPDTGSTQEVTIDVAAVSAEQPFGGLRINLIPREGGNQLRGSIFATGANSAWQGNNLSDELRDRGLPDPNEMKRAYDINPSVGGPLLRDRLWFFGSARWQENQSYIAGLYVNKNAGDASKWVPERDLTQRGVFSLNQKGVNLRLTGRAGERHKYSIFYDNQGRIWDDSRPTISPESTVAYRFPVLNLGQVGWTSTLTNKLLLEARYGKRGEAFGNQYPEEGSIYRELVPVIEQTTSLQYRGKGGNGGSSALFGYSTQKIHTATLSATYVTGSHSIKAGFTDTWATTRSSSQSNIHNMMFRFSGVTPTTPVSVPNQLTMYAPVAGGTGSKVIGEIGAFVQDRWTIDRLTINAGLRYDQFIGGYPEQTLGPTLYLPTRNLSFSETTGNNLKDFTPRAGVTYDLFGNGRTALKVNYGKYILAITPVGNPAGVVGQVTRNWNDANGNFWPDCDLINLQANGECQIASNLAFGLPTSVTAFNPDTRFGWGNRPWSAEFSTSVQHELAPRLGLDVGYFRRWYGNFLVTQNRARTAADYQPYQVTAPVDSRLPDGGGYVVSDLYDVVQAKAGSVDNYTTFARDFGKQTEHWNGVDVSVNARLESGLTMQGGLSTGRTSTNNCDVVGKTGNNPSPLYCDNVQNFLTQVKMLATYTVPRVDLQLAATLQSSPGPQVTAVTIFTNAQIAPSLGRNLSAGAANATINTIEPGTEFGDRANQLDLRVGKVLRFSGRRVLLNLDIYNALNANPVMQQQNNYAVWQQPQRIMEARLFKISGQFDF
jgi:hypothetical protein